MLIFWRSRSLWLKHRAFLPVQYLWIYAMIRLLTSYSKDKREKEAKYWYLSQKVKGQPFCNSFIALYFWQNIFPPLNHRCIQLWKQMKDDDKKTPRTLKDKKLLVKVSDECFPIDLCVYIIILWILQALLLRTCSLLLKFCELSMFWNIFFPLHRLFHMHSTRKVRYRASYAIPSNQPTEASLRWTWFKVGNPTQ